MESVISMLEGNGLDKLRKNPKTALNSGTEEPVGVGDPSCPRCDGLGFVVPDLRPGQPGFGRAVICACRLAEQKASQQSKLLKLSHIGALRECTFSTFIVDVPGVPEKMKSVLKTARDTAHEFAANPEGWLVLQGGYGCGKTHLAAAIANFQLDQDQPVLFINTPDLLDHLRGTFSPESTVSYDERFEEIRTAPLLIMDDLGTQSNSPWAQEKLYQLINYRYTERLPTVITTNLDEMDFEPRIRSRMFHEQVVTRVLRIDSYDFRRGVQASDQSELSTLDLHRHLTFDNFIVHRQDVLSNERKTLQEVRAAAEEYAQALKRGYQIRPWFVIWGMNHGNGKTHLAAAIANYVDDPMNKVVFVVVPDLLDYLRGAFDPSSRIGLDRRFDSIRKSHSLVVLDDLGTESATPFVREKLYQLFNYRYVASLPTVITTSVHIDRLDSHLISRMMDESKSDFRKLEVSSFYQPPTYVQKPKGKTPYKP